MNTSPLVSIIVLTLNEEKNIHRCLENVFNQETKYSFEVIVIDSASDDKTLEIAGKYPVRIHNIRRDAFHHGGTRNLGAELSQGDYLIYIAGDACPMSSNWLDLLVDPLLNDDRICAVYGKQFPKADCDPINTFRLSWNYQDKMIQKNTESLKTFGHRNYFFSTVNCSIRKISWKLIKFREDIPIFEDTAFAKELIDLGYTISYIPLAGVIHSHNLGVLDLFKRYRSMGFVQSKLNFIENLGKSFQSEGIHYLISGIKYLLHQHNVYWIGVFVLQTFMGYLGLNYGRYLSKSGREL
ncbi:MAG: glycosyltransferase family 2 protein [Bacteroidota bacterium]